MTAKVNTEDCTGCELCVGTCPVTAISMVGGKASISDDCVDCGACVGECPVSAISM